MERPERRRAPRTAVDLRVRYRHGEIEHFGTLADISESGLRLVGGETMPNGTRLTISFDDGAGRHHEVVGDVVRSESKRGFALSIVEMDDATLDAIRSAVAAP